ncbi:Fur-regulated basic protein FbpA [Bacillus sp. ISL-51]|uniref:Fur-regulated basic protein FbpA n=1 Tax=Bacteria TaxID=2 RepID=UPI001BECF955|nr:MULTISPECIES: Fur-regulated basic protein FbpA [Bacteria]MBT2572567.1 Fur-regulated basic protein FbpA [Bacillus sp. ISL-51]MBT2634501.1 Fur-regulated basic protein FbpA [Bacillus sp. ISL-26]MBT2711635.1 Fur-regulated basic protein FbpA [Pseudomonas sp. ISL-88]
MAPLLREAINRKKQLLQTKLIHSGFYQDHGHELAGYTLSELEKEYEILKSIKKKPRLH